jgi:hypothetical protein
MPKRPGLNLGKVEEVLGGAQRAEKGLLPPGSPPRTPQQEAEQTRRIRNNIFASGAYPYGERRINPARKQTAHEYDQWTKTQQSHSIHEGAYRDMLEAEERNLGQTSYPEGNPRRETAIRGHKAGRTVKDVIASQEERLNPRAPESAPERTGTGFGESPPAARPKVGVTEPEEPVRVNRFRAKCASCGEDILVGQGKMVRQPTRWTTVHNPKCPS